MNPTQVHGAQVAEVTSNDDRPGEADALATARPGILLGVLGADCPCLLLVDPVRRALTVVHAGWRGTVRGVAPAAVRFLHARFGSRPEDLRAGIGAGISGPRYEVGPDVVEAVLSAVPAAAAAVGPGPGDRRHLDLRAALRIQLLASGLRPESIETLPHCTFDEASLFFSHRRDGPRTGRHALVAGFLSDAGLQVR